MKNYVLGFVSCITLSCFLYGALKGMTYKGGIE